MNNIQNMKEHWVSTYGVRGGTKINQSYQLWASAPQDLGLLEPIRVRGKQLVSIITSSTEFRVEIVGVNQ